MLAVLLCLRFSVRADLCIVAHWCLHPDVSLVLMYVLYYLS